MPRKPTLNRGHFRLSPEPPTRFTSNKIAKHRAKKHKVTATSTDKEVVSSLGLLYPHVTICLKCHNTWRKTMLGEMLTGLKYQLTPTGIARSWRWKNKLVKLSKGNAIIDEQREVISTLIIRPTTQTPQSFGTPICKQKHSKITSPLQSHGKKIRHGGKLLFDQLPEFRQRPPRFQTHQLGKKAVISGNRPDPKNEIASQKSATIVGNALDSQSGTPLPAILSPNACWNMPERDSSEAISSPFARPSHSPYEPKSQIEKQLTPQKAVRSSLRSSCLLASQRIHQFSFSIPSAS